MSKPKRRIVQRGPKKVRRVNIRQLVKKAIRKSDTYKAWRAAIFQRDNYTCRHCGATGVYVQAHHIKAFSTHPELRFLVSNGITLCVPCHKKTDNYGIKALLQTKTRPKHPLEEQNGISQNEVEREHGRDFPN